MFEKQHIARRGRYAGRFTRCTAQGVCPIGGTHISTDELKKIQIWAGRDSIKEVSKNDYAGYMKADLDKKLAILDPRSMSSDERDQAYSVFNNDRSHVSRDIQISLNHEQWMKFLSDAFKFDVNIPLDDVKAGGAQFRNGATVLNVKSLPLRGTKENIEKLISTLL